MGENIWIVPAGWLPVDDVLAHEDPDLASEDSTDAVIDEWYPEWHKQASCLGRWSEADAFFYGQDGMQARPSLSTGQIKRARQICAGCPVADKCLTTALTNKERYGVWGGTTARFRRQILEAIDEGLLTIETAVVEWLLRLERDRDGQEEG